jgi:hypothetical protein
VAYFAGSGRLLAEMSQLASLSESARRIALERFRVLQPHLEQKRFLTQVARDAGIPILRVILGRFLPIFRTERMDIVRYRASSGEHAAIRLL